jgi:chromosome segregation ATPase
VKLEHSEKEIHAYKLKYEHASADDHHDDVKIRALQEKCHHLEQKVHHLEGEIHEVERYKREVTIYRAKYERSMTHNRRLKEKHVTLKVSYRSAGNHHTSSSSSSKSD